MELRWLGFNEGIWSCILQIVFMLDFLRLAALLPFYLCLISVLFVALIVDITHTCCWSSMRMSKFVRDRQRRKGLANLRLLFWWNHEFNAYVLGIPSLFPIHFFLVSSTVSTWFLPCLPLLNEGHRESIAWPYSDRRCLIGNYFCRVSILGKAPWRWLPKAG